MRTVVLASVLAGLLLLAALPASAGLAGWQYQREIAIQENSGETLHDYQVLVGLDGSDFPGEAQPDGDDIRFTDADGRELSYWIEEFDAGSEHAMIWVKVPLIPANGEAMVAMWCGNPGAESESDGEAVFEFFDDFSTNPNANGKWAIHRSSGDLASEASWDSANDIWYLTKAVGGKGVAVFANYDLTITSWKVDFNYLAGGGSGADGFVFMFYKDKVVYEIPASGGDLGFTSHSKSSKYRNAVVGYGVEFDNYRNDGGSGTPVDPTSANHIAIIKDDTSTHLAYVNDDRTEDNVWHDVEITFIAGRAIIEIDSDTVIDYVISSPSYAYRGIGFGAGTGGYNNNHIIDNVRVRCYTSPEPTITLASRAPATHTALHITKSPTPHSIRQFQETTITISIKNSGTTDATDIEITDAIHPSFDLTSGDFPNPKRYDLIRPGETRDLQYTIRAKESGTFTLDPATVTYADEDGNIQEASSEPASIKVIPSTEGGTSGGTSRSNPSVSTASVQLHGEKTNVVLGEDILLKLSAVNLITKPTMHVQVIIIPPSGMSVTSSAFAKSGAGQYTTTYELDPGSGKDIEVAIRSNQVGDFDVNGRIIYYFGDDRGDAEDHTLTLPITVRTEVEPKQTVDTSGSKEKGSNTPGFGAVVAVIGVLLVALLIKRRRLR